MIENGALVALAAENRRRRNGGVTPFDEDVRAAMNMNDKQIKALTRDMERNLTPRQAEQFTKAFAKERAAFNRAERKAAQQDERQHGR
jgi:aspartyl/asparaginyl beta-hydroxylase (cupin superfamily)